MLFLYRRFAPKILRMRSLTWVKCFRHLDPCTAGAPQMMHRLSRCMRSWYFRCRETRRAENSSLIFGLMVVARL
jgi:hypothetical protein